MIDPIIELPDGRRFPYSRIVVNTQSRVKHLGPFSKLNGEQRQAKCHCIPGGIPMGIAMRTRPVKTCYLYDLHRDDRKRHLSVCMLRILGERHASDQSEQSAISLSEGHLVVNVATCLYKLMRDTTGVSVAPNSTTEDDRVKAAQDTPRTPLCSVATALWSLADLNRWRPEWQGKRKYSVLHHRLVNASKHIFLRKNTPLASRFYMPPPYVKERKEEIRQELERFVKAITTLKGKKLAFGVFCGLIRELDYIGDDLVLRLAHSTIGLQLSATRHLCQVERFSHSGELDDSLGWFVVAVVAPGEVSEALGRGSTLEVVDLGLLRLTDNYLPCLSDHHEVLLRKLLQDGRKFHVPLPFGLSQESYQPAAIIEDTDVPTQILLRHGDPDESFNKYLEYLDRLSVPYDLVDLE